MAGLVLPLAMALLAAAQEPKVAAPPAPAIAPAGATSPTLVALDFKAQTIAQVVRALAERSGGAVGLSGINEPRWAEARVTLESPAPVPLLEAVDRLAEAGALDRSVTFAGPFSNPRPHFQFRNATATPVDDGPAAYVGPFRIGPVVVHERFERVFLRESRPPGPAVPATPPFFAEVAILAEPGLLYVRTGPPRRLEAADELGQSYLDPAVVADGRTWDADRLIHREPKALRLPLARPAKPAKGLAVLRGAIPLELARRPKAPTSVVPLAGASGKTFRDGGLAITVVEYRADGPGPTIVRLSAHPEGPRTEETPDGKGVREARLWTAYYHQLELADAQGRPVPIDGSAGINQDGDMAMSYSYTARPPGSKGAPPALLRIYRLDWVAWELPFEFRDLPLP